MKRPMARGRAAPGGVGNNVLSSANWQDEPGFAACMHRHQIRKDGATPYITHLTRVAWGAGAWITPARHRAQGRS